MASESTFKITCQHCGTRLKIKASARGKTIRCPNKACAVPIPVPIVAPAESASSATCYFCQERSGDGKSIKVSMYGNVKYVDTSVRAKFMTYNAMTLVFPRCQGCQSLHEKWERSHFVGCGIALGISLLAGGVGAIVTYFLLWPVETSDRGFVAFFFGGGFVFLTLFLLATVVFKVRAAGYFRRQGIKSYPIIYSGKFDEFPEIMAKLSEGWWFGDKPPNAGRSLSKQAQAVVWNVVTDIRDVP